MRRADVASRVGVDSFKARGRVGGLPGQVLDTAALLTEGQLSARLQGSHQAAPCVSEPAAGMFVTL